MTDLRKAAEMALEALQNYIYMPPKKLSDAITALRQALEQPIDIEAAVKKENEACSEIAYSMVYSEDEAEEIAKAIRAMMK